MGKIEKILKKGPVEGQTTEVYPVTSTKAIYDENNKRLDNIITGLQESVYLNTPIPISTDNTTESMAQNVKNITDYIEKAKAAGIEDVNGMAVTCIIDDDYSGIGYIYDLGGDFNVQGVLIKDNLVDNMCFSVSSNGNYLERGLIVSGNGIAEVNSYMLDKGARNPIIFTLETTEVDEETYQKLLSDDVDVMFMGPSGNLCTLTNKDSSWSGLILYFTYFSVKSRDVKDSYISSYNVSITKNNPHTCHITKNYDFRFSSFLTELGYLKNSTLSPVLQEIDLTGTNADRKAKLDKFETDWKKLTGASDLAGARFVGYTGEPDNFIGIFIYNSSIEGGYSAIATSDGLSTYQVFISPTGAMISNSLFYHLEPITIRTDNTDSDMAYNVAAIQKYVNNLTFLGVYTYSGFTIPVSLTGNEFCGYLICNEYHEDDRLVLSGTVFFEGIAKIIVIDETGRYEEIVEIAGTNPLNTTSDNMIDAINEVNTLAKSKGNGTITEVKMNGVSKGTSGVVDLGTVITAHQDISGKVDKTLNAKAFEGITLEASNTTEAMNANKAAIQAYANNLIELGVDTTKGFMVSVKVNFPSDRGYYGYMASNYVEESYFLSGTIFKTYAGENYVKNITINPMGRCDEIVSTAS